MQKNHFYCCKKFKNTESAQLWGPSQWLNLKLDSARKLSLDLSPTEQLDRESTGLVFSWFSQRNNATRNGRHNNLHDQIEQESRTIYDSHFCPSRARCLTLCQKSYAWVSPSQLTETHASVTPLQLTETTDGSKRSKPPRHSKGIWQPAG